jgi:hypothetical protein
MPTLEPHLALPTSVDFAHWIISARVSPGDQVIDATAGNGHDTTFLAQCVGAAGRVWAFDVQAAAIASTRERLAGLDLLERCTLIHAGHECMADHLPAESCGQIAAAVFNLGWLPGHDKSCITLPHTTLAALRCALEWLRPGAPLIVVVYPGHEGGADESAAVAAWASALPSNTHEVRHFRPANRTGRSPECWALRVRPALG